MFIKKKPIIGCLNKLKLVIKNLIKKVPNLYHNLVTAETNG